MFKKFKIIEVDLLDNNFLVDKIQIRNSLFDENYFLYFETFDFTHNLAKQGKKIYVVKKIRFHHLGSSLRSEYKNLIIKTRSFHYSWSKFYYLKKNFNYFFALRKILPNIFQSIKKILIGIIKLDFRLVQLSLLELLGIFSGILYLKSFYRPKNT